MQLGEGDRGFSFSKEGPLDMRMDRRTKLTAKEIVNRWSEKELGEIFRDFGEEPQWRRAAATICDARRRGPIETTQELAEIVAGSIRGKKRLHPATLIFQALRMCVNDELESIQKAIVKAMHFLSPGGRMGVISFHRLEDRIVKNLFRDAAVVPKANMQKKVAPPKVFFQLLTKKPLVPSETEVRKNPRSRSAKLRFIERMSEG